jgi:hypothetical protein
MSFENFPRVRLPVINSLWAKKLAGLAIRISFGANENPFERPISTVHGAYRRISR